MTVKSVIDIEINDEEFQAFAAKFAKYKEAVSALPDAWSSLDKGVQGTATGFQDMTASLLAQRALFREQDRSRSEANREAREAQKAELEALKAKKSALDAMQAKITKQRQDTKQIAFDMRNTAVSIAEGAVGLAKWIGIGGIASGLLGAGGFFGLDKLAGTVSDNRKSALGLGVTTGQQSAFNLNLGQVIDSNSALQNLAAIRQDASQGYVFKSLGISSPQSKNPAELLAEAAIKAKQLFDPVKNTQTAQQFADARGLTKIFSMSDLRALGNISSEELQTRLKRARADSQTLGQQDAINRKWQDFSAGLSRAGLQIQNVLVDKLTGLTGPLTHLSSAFADVIATFLGSDTVKVWLKEAATALEQFAHYIGTPKFKTDMETFVSDFGKVVDAIVSAMRKLGVIPDPDPKLRAQQRNWLPKDPFMFGTKQYPFGVGKGPDYGIFQGPVNLATGALGSLGRELPGGAPAWQTNMLAGKWGVGGVGADQSNSGKPWDISKPPVDGEKAVVAAANTWHVSADLMRRVFGVESGSGRNTGYSSAGALGPMQLMSKTATQYGVTDRMDMHQSAEAAAHYMSDLLREFRGDMKKAVAAYNWGQGNVERDVRQHGAAWMAYAPRETQAYVRKTVPTVNVTIHNPAGAQVSVQASQLPQ